jgi:hypothetical protein
MKQGDYFIGQRISAGYSAALSFVTTPASKAQVFKRGFPALTLRNDVINGQGLAGVLHRGLAIGAQLAICSLKPLA